MTANQTVSDAEMIVWLLDVREHLYGDDLKMVVAIRDRLSALTPVEDAKKLGDTLCKHFLVTINLDDELAQTELSEKGYHLIQAYGDARAAAAIPDGWVLVPKEPTEAMQKAGRIIRRDDQGRRTTTFPEIEEIKALIAAAPQPEKVTK